MTIRTITIHGIAAVTEKTVCRFMRITNGWMPANKENYIQLLDSYEKDKYRRVAIMISTVMFAWAAISTLVLSLLVLCVCKW